MQVTDERDRIDPRDELRDNLEAEANATRPRCAHCKNSWPYESAIRIGPKTFCQACGLIQQAIDAGEEMENEIDRATRRAPIRSER